MAPNANCIYCGNAFDPRRGEGDHIIPVQLGAFRGDVRFRGMCSSCNGRIGRSEQQIVQSGPEGFFRCLIKPNSKRLNKRGLGRPRGAMGARPPQHTVYVDGLPFIGEPQADDPQKLLLVDQILLIDRDGAMAHIRLFPGIRAEQVRSAVTNTGLGEIAEMHGRCDEERSGEYATVLKSIWPGSRFEARESTPAGMLPESSGAVKFSVNVNYFQAIAKIGFHYFLAHSERGFTGGEPFFTGVRQFIIHGIRQEQFVDCNNQSQFRAPYGKLATGGVLLPTRWCHLMAACEEGGQAIAHVQLFVGPQCVMPPYHLWLGRWGDARDSSSGRWAHAYVYDDPQQVGPYAGTVESLVIEKLNPR